MGALPGAVLGVWIWLAPAESQAAPTCTTKPAVCARLAASKKPAEPVLLVQSQAARPVVARQAAPIAPCVTKPAVCARLDPRGARPAAAPVTLASGIEAGARCNSKPAVCARSRVRPGAAPITLATTAGEPR